MLGCGVNSVLGDDSRNSVREKSSPSPCFGQWGQSCGKVRWQQAFSWERVALQFSEHVTEV